MFLVQINHGFNFFIFESLLQFCFDAWRQVFSFWYFSPFFFKRLGRVKLFPFLILQGRYSSISKRIVIFHLCKLLLERLLNFLSQQIAGYETRNFWIKKFVLFLDVGNLVYFINDRHIFNIVSVIPTVESKVGIIHKLVKIFFNCIFSILPISFIHRGKVSFEAGQLKSIMRADFCYFPKATCY